MIHIEMEDNYNQTTYYYGTADGKSFTVVCYYDSSVDNWELGEITWSNEDLSTLPLDKTESKIRDFVSKWLFDKQEDKENE